ncbi:MAG: hypothetical protein M1360_04840 [Candidatus Marsarchaeota archaeon]|jgi:hypothetical protein|nr:hypothetical protein [Candidatus Marsarchaeota archaeon]MCL5419231.1 hypothetical protein [Candidatus Marsarchaeota archaeon]
MEATKDAAKANSDMLNAKILSVAGEDIDAFSIAHMLYVAYGEKPIAMLEKLGIRGNDIVRMHNLLGYGFPVKQAQESVYNCLKLLYGISSDDLDRVRALSTSDGKFYIESFLAVSLGALYDSIYGRESFKSALAPMEEDLKRRKISGRAIFEFFVRETDKSMQISYMLYSNEEAKSAYEKYKMLPLDQRGSIMLMGLVSTVMEKKGEEEKLDYFG